MLGKVKWFNEVKGFGFIARDGGGKDVFCHYSEIQGPGKGKKNLTEGQAVEFTLDESDPKGPRAKSIFPK